MSSGRLPKLLFKYSCKQKSLDLEMLLKHWYDVAKTMSFRRNRIVQSNVIDFYIVHLANKHSASVAKIKEHV